MIGSHIANVRVAAAGGDYEAVSSVSKEMRRVFVIGDVAVDRIGRIDFGGSSLVEQPEPALGGTGVGASRAFLNSNQLEPVMFGRVGADPLGRFVLDSLVDLEMTALVRVDENLPTAECTILHSDHGHQRVLIKNDQNSANNYSVEDLGQALELSNLADSDYIFLVCHFLVRLATRQAESVMELLGKHAAKLVLDLVPHDLHEVIDHRSFLSQIVGRVFGVVAEYPTISGLVGLPPHSGPPGEVLPAEFSKLDAQFVVIRFGRGNIDQESVYERRADGQYVRVAFQDTGYSLLEPHERTGFGDALTLRLFEDHFCRD